MNKVTCSCCGEAKSSENFYKNSRKKNGLESQCIECVLAAKRKSRAKKVGKKDIASKVISVGDCTFDERQIIRPKKMVTRLEELVGELLWQEKQRRYSE